MAWLPVDSSEADVRAPARALDAAPIADREAGPVLDLDREQVYVAGEWVSFDSPFADTLLADPSGTDRGGRSGEGTIAVSVARRRQAVVAVVTLGLVLVAAAFVAVALRNDDVDAAAPAAQPMLQSGLGAVPLSLAETDTWTRALPKAPALDELAPAATVVAAEAPGEAPAAFDTATRETDPLENNTLVADAFEGGPARAEAIERAVPLDLDTALPGWELRFEGTHPQWRGVTNSSARTIVLFDRPGHSVAEAAEILAHEVGHALDLTYLDEADRGAWLQLRSIDTGWWAGDAEPDFAVGSGDFAEAVAAYLLDSPSHSEYGEFTDTELDFVAQILERIDG